MAEKRDFTSLLQSIEDDYRHDMAVHLFSTYLLHLKDPFFPRRAWSSWPLSPQAVPDPKTTQRYVEEPLVVVTGRPSESRGSSRAISVEPSVAAAAAAPPTVTQSRRRYRTDKLFLTEELSDPLGGLALELRALVTRKVNARVHGLVSQTAAARALYRRRGQIKKSGLAAALHQAVHAHRFARLPLQRRIDFDAAPTAPDGIPEAVIDRLRGRVDELIKRVVEDRAARTITRKRASLREGRTRPPRLMDWRDLLLCVPHGAALERCQRLFDNPCLPRLVEYETETESETEGGGAGANHTPEYAARAAQRLAAGAAFKAHASSLLAHQRRLQTHTALPELEVSDYTYPLNHT